MDIRFSPTFKNNTLAALVGATVTRTPLMYVQFYNDVSRPADPSVAAVGSGVYASLTTGVVIDTFLSPVGSGVSQLVSAQSRSATNNVSALTFARISNNTGVGLIDADIGTTTSAAIVVPSLISNAGSNFILSQMAVKMPTSLGTIRINQPLANRLVEFWTGAAAGPTVTAPAFGINPGSAASTISVYTGSAPATADEAATGTLLISISIGGTNVFGTPAAGAVALASTPSGATSGSGTAGYLRWTKTQGAFTFVMQGSVGVAGSGADFILNALVHSGGSTLTLTDATISL